MAPSSPHLCDLLARASESPNAVVFVTPRGRDETTFQHVWKLSTGAANGFLRSRAGRPCAGVMTASAEMVACFLGVLRAGSDFVSLPLPRRGQTLENYSAQTRRILELAGADVIITERAYQHVLGPLASCADVRVLEAEAVVSDAANDDRTPDSFGRLIQFSSGTTGVPKGVSLTGSAIGASIQATLEAIGDWRGGRCHWVPLSHDMGLIGGLLTGWASTLSKSGNGGAGAASPCTYMSPELFLARPLTWLEQCASSRARVITGPTFAYQILSRQLRSAPELDLSSLEVCLVGAEPIHPETLREFEKSALRHHFDPRALCPAYGLAEASLAVSIDPPFEHWSTKQVAMGDSRHEYVSCGRVLPCVNVVVEGAGGVPGQIKIRGPAVCEAVFGSVAGAPGANGYRNTGDMGLLTDGELVITGRTDDLLCLAGRNFFAWELEAELSECGGVRAGNCAVVPDGRGRYVVMFEPAVPNTDFGDLLRTVRRRLARFAGIGPSAVGCLPRGEIPKTASGKIRRNAIAADLAGLRTACIAFREF
jgi:acyl-CoA synthetase (AMP-forming)/AMP-acid ligase II